MAEGAKQWRWGWHWHGAGAAVVDGRGVRKHPKISSLSRLAACLHALPRAFISLALAVPSRPRQQMSARTTGKKTTAFCLFAPCVFEVVFGRVGRATEHSYKPGRKYYISSLFHSLMRLLVCSVGGWLVNSINQQIPRVPRRRLIVFLGIWRPQQGSMCAVFLHLPKSIN